MFNLNGKSALVTGATGGIGCAIAKTLANLGANLIISGTKEEKLKQLASEIQGDCKYLTCDLSDTKQVEELFDNAENLNQKPIDIIICNAGITKDSLILRMKTEDFENVVNVNLKSTFILNRNAIKKMIKNKYGRIINIASVVALTGNPGQANYVASKSGMIGMTKAMAQEVASRNITINCVAPGFIQSPMTDILNDQQKTAILSKIPAGRMGDAQDIANAVAFLSSQEASYITGSTIRVNGGVFMN